MEQDSVEFRVCSKCGNKLPLTEEYFPRSKKWFRRYCKSCQSKARKEYYETHKEENRLYTLQYCQKHREQINARKKELREANKEHALEVQRKNAAKYRARHKEQIAEYNKRHVIAYRERRAELVRERRREDQFYRLACQVRHLVWSSFKRQGFAKDSKTEEITGLSKDDLTDYLLSTYLKNYGEEWDGKQQIHIDHIVPLSSAKTKEDIIALCHYTNLQLLTKSDNLKKGARVLEGGEENAKGATFGD